MLSSTQANHSCAVRIGVHSCEAAPATYRVQVTSNGTQVASWPSIMLTTQQEWDRVLPVSPAVGGSAVVDARLYRLDRPGVIYREVHVTLRSCGILFSPIGRWLVLVLPGSSDRRFDKQPGAFPRTHPTWAGRRVVE